jgi:hypothetical protein
MKTRHTRTICRAVSWTRLIAITVLIALLPRAVSLSALTPLTTAMLIVVWVAALGDGE